MKRSVLSLVLALSICLSMAVPAFATDYNTANKMADNLYDAGLFTGMSTGRSGMPIYALTKTATRAQAITMLVRVLGKAQEAERGTWETPFTDVPNWAKPYVGYAYANGLTSGTSATTFGANDLITPNQYLTFLLTALGYDKTVDFKWNDPYDLAASLGLVEAGEWKNTDSFKRADMVTTSYGALLACSKGTSTRLADKLGVGTHITPLDTPNFVGYAGVGVNADKNFDPNNPLEGMPNTAALIKKLDLGYSANYVALSVNFVGLRSNYGPGTMVLEGFAYSSIDQDRHDVCIAFLRDVLDAESADALIDWLDELNTLHAVYYKTDVDSPEEVAAEAELDAHGSKLWEAKAPVAFGNITVEWETYGNVISIIMRNK